MVGSFWVHYQPARMPRLRFFPTGRVPSGYQYTICRGCGKPVENLWISLFVRLDLNPFKMEGREAGRRREP